MLIQLHSQATTTPKVRAAIQASAEPASALAERFGTTEQTVYKWKHRDSVHDRSHTPHRLQTTLFFVNLKALFHYSKSLVSKFDALVHIL
jgi:hypothetical protein